jgi:predicted RecA/RadA family phage recombinase
VNEILGSNDLFISIKNKVLHVQVSFSDGSAITVSSQEKVKSGSFVLISVALDSNVLHVRLNSNIVGKRQITKHRSNSGQRLVVGRKAYSTTSSGPLNGDICEVILFDERLSGETLLKLERTLMEKWDLDDSESGIMIVPKSNAVNNQEDTYVEFQNAFRSAPDVNNFVLESTCCDSDQFIFSAVSITRKGFTLRTKRLDNRNGWSKGVADIGCKSNYINNPGSITSLGECQAKCLDTEGCTEVTFTTNKYCRVSKSIRGCRAGSDLGGDPYGSVTHYRRGWNEDLKVRWSAHEKTSHSTAATLISYATENSNKEFLMQCDGSVSIAGSSFKSSANIHDGKWHHIALTWKSTGGRVNMLLDGSIIDKRGTGQIYQRKWYFPQVFGNLENFLSSDVFLGDVSFPKSEIIISDKFESTSSAGSYYVIELSGVFVAPNTGTYNFYVSGDDEATLYLSSDQHRANLQLIASLSGCTSSVAKRKYDVCASQKSVKIALKATNKYYMVAYVRQLTGSDHLSVGVTMPDGSSMYPISCSMFELPGEFGVASGKAIASGGTVAVGELQAASGVASSVSTQEIYVDDLRL